jgi:TonB family protein
MKNLILICFLFISIAAKAQDNDTTIVDIRKSTFGHKITIPLFKGTDAEYGAFITKNFHHPSPEKENSIGGRVVLLCLVEKDGSISSIKVDSSVTKKIDAEAIRVVRLMPKFTIGTLDGKPARYLVDLHMGFYYNPQNQ